MSTPLLPSWPYCGHGADPATDPVGCCGIHVPGHTVCLAHLTDTDRTAYLTGLAPGADIDHRGTPFTQGLLEALLDALNDSSTGKPHLGTAGFDGARFSGDAGFDSVQFSGDAGFSEAWFSGRAGFEGVQFSGDARFTRAQFSSVTRFGVTRFSGDAMFHEAQFSADADFSEAQFSAEAWFSEAHFSGEAWFSEAQFTGPAWFSETQFTAGAGFSEAQFSDSAWFSETQFTAGAGFSEAQFSGETWFGGARFSGNAWFGEAQFSGNAGFDGAQFSGNAEFNRARFVTTSWFGPLLSAQTVDLSAAVFEVPVTLEIAARELRCERSRWESTAILRLRYVAADLSHAVLSFPMAVTAHPAPFACAGVAVDENLLAGSVQEVRVVSVRGVDAAHLVLSDTDLSDCLFAGAFHLDQIRLEGRTTFAGAPTGWHRRGTRPVRFTRRRVLAEEHHWRAHAAGQPALPAGEDPEPHLWRPGPHHPDPARTPDPEDVAALYRQLRKAFEDGKNEPGAADFYYGEMEMRRHDRTGTTQGERHLLWGYWLLSGYGLRASRAFTWLLAAMSLTVLLLMNLGLPTHDPSTIGTLHGSKISLDTSDPALHGAWSQRMTWDRAEKATRVAVNSVVFRSSGQNLTTAGTYIEMASRLLEPTLLALAALAIRGRIKR